MSLKDITSKLSQNKKQKMAQSSKPNNPFGRMHNSETSAALFVSKKNDTLTVEQMGPESSFYRPIEIGTPIKKNGTDVKEQLEASLKPEAPHTELPFNTRTPGKTLMVSKRSVPMKITYTDGSTSSARTYFLSPLNGKFNEDRLKNKTNINDSKKRKLNQLKTKLSFDGSNAQNKDNPTIPDIKGGDILNIRPYKRIRKTAPSQNKVMGLSAQDALKYHFDWLEQNKNKYNEYTFKILKEFVEKYSLEWLHLYAFSLCPKNINPQDTKNLGGAPTWINTSMMVLEKIALHFAQSNTLDVDVKSLFKMLENSELVKTIHYEVNIQKKEQAEKLINIKSNNKSKIDTDNNKNNDTNNNNTNNDPEISAIKLFSSWDILKPPSRENWAGVADTKHLLYIVEALLTQYFPNKRTLLAFS